VASAGRTRWLVGGCTAVVITLTGALAQGASSGALSPSAGACVFTGVAPSAGEACPAPTRVQRALLRSVEQAAASAAQADIGAQGAPAGSRLRDWAEAAQRASNDAVQALAQAQTAAATSGAGSDATIADAARRAEHAADEAARAATRAELEAARIY